MPVSVEPIALIGAACRLPGAPNLQALAQLLYAGRDAVTEIPDDRWNKTQFFHPDRSQAGKSYTFSAGVIDQIYGFDPAFFGISPREAAQIDPQQRLLLELAYEAFEDAGLKSARLAGQHVGVYVGGSAWDHSALHTGDPAMSDAYTMTGTTLCSLANRISYAFDLHGPSFTVDTACSSSLVALHLACEAIRSGQVPMALVGGVNLLLSPQSFIGFCRASMLSPNGRCHAFDARANGYVRAEGGGIIVLKRLSDALADGDHIRAVIRGTGVNSDGRTTGISLPSQAAQAALLREVYGRFNVRAEELSYVEAHGTGTAAGDPIEAGALGEVLGGSRARKLPIGSIKTNIGHLEAGSGIAGLMKVLVTLQNGRVPPSLHCETPNPNIAFDTLGLQLVPQAIDLPAGPHVVGINSFGFGGTNAHAVLASAPAASMRPVADGAPAQQPAIAMPLLLSARSEGALRDLAVQWRARLDQQDGDLAQDLRSVARLRDRLPVRLAALGSDVAELRTALDAYLAGKETASAITGTAVGTQVVFAFSGNGSQWAGMGLDALKQSPAFATALETVDAELQPLLGWSVIERLGGVNADAMRDTSIAQPLLFAIQVAIVQVLRGMGITPAACFGHSVGEVAAAWASGALSLAQAAQVIVSRSAHQHLTTGNGRMAVLGMSRADAEKALAEAPGLEIAAENSSSACTIAGPEEAMNTLAELAEARKWPFTRLDLDYAFHSAAMEPTRAPLLADLASLKPGATVYPLISTVSGTEIDGTELNGTYWWRNVREPVLFTQAARHLVAQRRRVFLEIGPQPVLQAYLHDALRLEDATGRVLSVLGRRRTPRDPFVVAAGRCFAAGFDLAETALFAGDVSPVPLPHYPWQREEYKIIPTTEATDTLHAPLDHPLLGYRRDVEADRWFRHLDTEIDLWLADHAVGGSVVVPAAGIVDAALGAARTRHPGAASLEILDLEINRAIVLESGQPREVRLQVQDEHGGFHLQSRPRLAGDAWLEHAAGRVTPGTSATPVLEGLPTTPPTARRDAVTLYALTSSIGLEYGPEFQSVTNVDMYGPAEAVVHLRPTAGHTARVQAGYLIDPALLDGALQGLVALAADRVTNGTAMLPWRFGRVRLLRPQGATPACAHVRVTHVGPRAICADIRLLDCDGAAVLEALECWFVSVRLGTGGDAADPTFRIEMMPVADARAEAVDGALLETALGAVVMDDPQGADMAALGDAACGIAAYGALKAGTAVQSDLADAMYGWLQADGLAQADRALAAGDDLPAFDEILRSILFDQPAAVADAALLAQAAGDLPRRLREDSLPAAPGALVDQFLYHSPAGARVVNGLIDAACALAGEWPKGRVLRVLELGGGRGGVTRRVLRGLRQCDVALEYTVRANADDASAARDVLAGEEGVHVTDAELARLGSFDLVLGLYALTWDLFDPAALQQVLAPGGMVLLAEPTPNRVWSLLPLPAPQAASIRERALSVAGLLDVRACELAPALWPAVIMGARVAATQADAISDETVLLAAPAGDALAAGLTQDLRAQGVDVRALGFENLAAQVQNAAPGATRLVVVFPDSDPHQAAFVLAGLAALAEPMSGLNLPMSWAVRANATGEAFAQALTGLRRVMANEAPEIACRVVRLGRELDDSRAASHLAREVLYPDADAEICWTGSGRLAAHARHGLPQERILETGDAVLGVGRPGLLDTLQWNKLPQRRAPQAGEVAIDVRAAGLNFRDVMWAMGLLPDEALLHGFAGPTLGLECAGVVTEVGPDVTDLRPGDRVMAFAPASLSTHTVTRRHATVKLPEGMEFADAATVPVAFLTTAYALGALAHLRDGEIILIHGGAGGVGLAAIQYALHRGAVVIATAGSDTKRALLRQLGVDHVLDSRSLTFADEVMRITHGQGVDVVLNSLSGEPMDRSLRLLKPFGRFLELGKRDFYENTQIGLRPFRHNISYFAIDADQLPTSRPTLAAELLAEVADLMAQGALRPLPYRLFGFDEVQEAFRLMQGSGHIGKIVLVPPTQGMKVLSDSIPSFMASSDGAYVVSGGLTGFGLATAGWLVDHGVRRVALLGRRGMDAPGAAQAVAALQARGVQASAHACDVVDKAALEAVLNDIRAQGPIRGVVHAAVVMDDGFLPQMDATRFERSLGAKWAGAENLDALTRGDTLDMFLMFSSITTALGNPGQANYVAANSALEAIAERRRAQGLPGLAVGWGAIADVGYLARTADVSDALSRRLGASHATAEQALSALPRLLASGAPVAMRAEMSWGAARKGLPLLGTSLFTGFAEEAEETMSSTDLRALVAGKTEAEAQSLVAGLLAEEIGGILKLAADRIDPARPLSELGMDSLMAVELRLAAEARFGITLPLFSLAEGATLNALAGRVVKPLLTGAPTDDAVPDAAMGFLARLEPEMVANAADAPASS